MERLKVIAFLEDGSVIQYLHSSMERLKVVFPLPESPRIKNLHSSMERLKGPVDVYDSDEYRNLHSSMERLKGVNAASGGYYLIRFTFQYGEIKRVDCRKNGLL